MIQYLIKKATQIVDSLFYSGYRLLVKRSCYGHKTKRPLATKNRCLVPWITQWLSKVLA
ncbi:unnamed protein product [Acidithrix sp. C25]|nr:unnamed protein product [Acidithrix sp. C25]